MSKEGRTVLASLASCPPGAIPSSTPEFAVRELYHLGLGVGSAGDESVKHH